MLPFGHGFPLGIPQLNVLGSRVLLPHVPVIPTSTNASLMPTPAMPAPQFFPSLQPQHHHPPHQQQPQPAPMMIAPGVLNEMPVYNDAQTPRSQTDSPALSADGNATKLQWSEHVNSDGRVYYYNREKKTSSWTKPDELKTTEEKEKGVWRVYKTAEGKPYYYNTVTKATTWTKPVALMENESKTPLADDQKQPIPLITSADSDLERAMAATLKKLAGGGGSDGNTSSDNDEKASTSTRKENNNSAAANDAAETNADDVKKRQVDKFKELIREKYENDRLNTGMSWEQAMKCLQSDSRFKVLPKVSEKKQVYNAWRIQRAKEERDEKRLAIKKAKEDLEKWLLENPRMKSTLSYHRADALFAGERPWSAVSESERREIFHDVLQMVAKREERERKELRERNSKALADILDGIDEIDHRTTWAQAQRILIENPSFANDKVLQAMDKEDALIVFQDHIRAAEELYVKERELEAKRMARQERKVREAFLQLLQELNQRGTLTSTSTWSAMFPVISTEARFENMLQQTGSTALDLFKFFVEDLKNRYYEDRHLIREILAAQNVQVTTATTLEELQQWVRSDERGRAVDNGNMKLCFNSLYDKAQSKEREKEREIQRRQKRQESSFRDLLRALSPAVEPESEWSVVRERIKSEDAFIGIESEDVREHYFHDYLRSLADACGHSHHDASYDNGNGSTSSTAAVDRGRKKNKKEKRKKNRKKEERTSDSEGEPRAKKSKKSHRRRDDSVERPSSSRRRKTHRRSRSRTFDDGGDAKRKHSNLNGDEALSDISSESDARPASDLRNGTADGKRHASP